MKATSHNRLTLAASLALLAGSGQALAHHPMGGETPSTLWQGLLSGLGHPIIGMDHLAFIVAVGLLCAFAGWRSPALPLALVAATVLGAALQWGGFTLPHVELVVAASVIAAGFLLVRAPGQPGMAGLAGALAAVFHGLAYGEAIIGAEPAPLGAYLVGFSLIQMLIAGIAFVAGRAALGHGPRISRTTRTLSAAVISGIGLLALSSAALT